MNATKELRSCFDMHKALFTRPIFFISSIRLSRHHKLIDSLKGRMLYLSRFASSAQTIALQSLATGLGFRPLRFLIIFSNRLGMHLSIFSSNE